MALDYQTDYIEFAYWEQIETRKGHSQIFDSFLVWNKCWEERLQESKFIEWMDNWSSEFL